MKSFQIQAPGGFTALIGIGNHRNDSQVHRDAATALSNMVLLDDIKLRLLKAPDGLKALLYPTRSLMSPWGVGSTPANMSTGTRPKRQSSRGGLHVLLKLTTVKDEKTKRRAVQVLRRCASHEKNRRGQMMNEGAIKVIMDILYESPDAVMRNDLIQTVNLLTTEQSNKEVLVEFGMMGPLLRHIPDS